MALTLVYFHVSTPRMALYTFFTYSFHLYSFVGFKAYLIIFSCYYYFVVNVYICNTDLNINPLAKNVVYK